MPKQKIYKIYIGTICAFVILLAVGIYLAFCETIQRYLYTIELRIFHVFLSWLMLRIGTGVCLFSAMRRLRKEVGGKATYIFVSICKMLVFLLGFEIWWLIFMGKSIRSFWNGTAESRQGIISWLEFMIGRPIILTLMLGIHYMSTNQSIFKCIKELDVIYARMCIYLRDIILGITMTMFLFGLLLHGKGDFMNGVQHLNTAEYSIFIPIIVFFYMMLVNQLYCICRWNYIWEDTYKDTLARNKVAPNIETVPFPR